MTASFLRGVSAATAGPATSAAPAARRKSRRESTANPRLTHCTESVIELARQIELRDLNPLVLRVRLGDLARSKDDGGYSGGGGAGRVCPVRHADFFPRAGDRLDVREQLVGQ